MIFIHSVLLMSLTITHIWKSCKYKKALKKIPVLVEVCFLANLNYCTVYLNCTISVRYTFVKGLRTLVHKYIVHFCQSEVRGIANASKKTRQVCRR